MLCDWSWSYSAPPSAPRLGGKPQSKFCKWYHSQHCSLVKPRHIHLSPAIKAINQLNHTAVTQAHASKETHGGQVISLPGASQTKMDHKCSQPLLTSCLSSHLCLGHYAQVPRESGTHRTPAEKDTPETGFPQSYAVARSTCDPKHILSEICSLHLAVLANRKHRRHLKH